jgi:hypothetical protein
LLYAACGSPESLIVSAAEDAGKIDQYTRRDLSYNPEACDLHQTLFTKMDPHKGCLHYAVVCRALLGCALHTRNGQTNLQDKGSVFATDEHLELINIPVSSVFSKNMPYSALVHNPAVLFTLGTN